jgi:hypothetical protein
LALGAALVLYVGFFHAGLVREVGLDALLRLDLLPEFIAQHMNRDAMFGVHRILPRGVVFSCLYSAIELPIVFLIIAVPAYFRSQFAFCESCGRWMRSIVFHTNAGLCAHLANALEDGALSDLPQIVGRGTMFGQHFAAFEFEYCTGLREPGRRCAAYLTLKEFSGIPEEPTTLMSQGRLWPDELDALADCVPALAWLRVTGPRSAVKGAAAEEQETTGAARGVPGERLFPRPAPLPRTSEAVAVLELPAPDAGADDGPFRTDRFLAGVDVGDCVVGRHRHDRVGSAMSSLRTPSYPWAWSR